MRPAISNETILKQHLLQNHFSVVAYRGVHRKTCPCSINIVSLQILTFGLVFNKCFCFQSPMDVQSFSLCIDSFYAARNGPGHHPSCDQGFTDDWQTNTKKPALDTTHHLEIKENKKHPALVWIYFVRDTCFLQSPLQDFSKTCRIYNIAAIQINLLVLLES